MFAFMTYGQFPPKSSSDLIFVVRDSRVRGLREAASNPWILDDKWWISATFRLKSTIGHKTTYSSFTKLIYKNFFSFDRIATFSHIGFLWPQLLCKEPYQIFPKWPWIIPFITTINMNYISLMESKVKPNVSSRQEW